MSALPPKPDMCGALAHVRFGPKADIGWLPALACINPLSAHRPGLMVDCATVFDPILEATEIIDLPVAHILEHLSAQSGATAGRTIEDDCFVLSEILVVVRRFGIGPKLQHTARHVHGTGHFAALFYFGRIAHVDNERVAFAYHFARLCWRDARDCSIGDFHHLFYAGRHDIS